VISESKPHERIWLEEVRARLSSGQPLDYREMMVALRDKLPPGFTPSQIDPEYLQGSQLTVEGIHALDLNAQELKDLERLILNVKEWVTKDPQRQKVSAKECSAALGISEPYAGRLLALTGTLGGYWSSAAGTPDGSGYTEVSITSLDTLATYLKFTSLEDALRDRARRRQAPRPTTIQMESVAVNTAFIIMSMDASDPMLEDVSNGVKDVCKMFGIIAKRSDDFEHSGQITDLILRMIRTSDILIADVTGERPNVYYEIGYAHALNKKPIVYRRAGTRLHFDLSVHNVPEYTNVSDLKHKLERRLEAVLGRSAGPTP
jgi:nucleoside 2-deoxyribosyltransferase